MKDAAVTTYGRGQKQRVQLALKRNKHGSEGAFLKSITSAGRTLS